MMRQCRRLTAEQAAIWRSPPAGKEVRQLRTHASVVAALTTGRRATTAGTSPVLNHGKV